MLFGGKVPTAGVLDYTGVPGKMSTVKLAFDTTNVHGGIGTGGVEMAGDRAFETSPARILNLPTRLDNLQRDQQVPVLTTEPNSAMVAEVGNRLAVRAALLQGQGPG